jgi:hypothetical protein
LSHCRFRSFSDAIFITPIIARYAEPLSPISLRHFSSPLMISFQPLIAFAIAGFADTPCQRHY